MEELTPHQPKENFSKKQHTGRHRLTPPPCSSTGQMTPTPDTCPRPRPTTLTPSARAEGGVPALSSSWVHPGLQVSPIKSKGRTTVLLLLPWYLRSRRESRATGGHVPAVRDCTGHGYTARLIRTRNAAAAGKTIEAELQSLAASVWAATRAPHWCHCSRDNARWGGTCWSEPVRGAWTPKVTWKNSCKTVSKVREVDAAGLGQCLQSQVAKNKNILLLSPGKARNWNSRNLRSSGTATAFQGLPGRGGVRAWTHQRPPVPQNRWVPGSRREDPERAPALRGPTRDISSSPRWLRG